MLPCLSLIVLGLAAPADAPDAKKELEKFQGTWSVVSVEDNGAKAAEESLKKRKVIIKDETYTIKDDDAVVEEGAFSLDPSKKPPAIVKMRMIVNGRVAPLPGIYELNGDDLKVCFGPPGKPPAEFKAPADSGCQLIVLKRDKK